MMKNKRFYRPNELNEYRLFYKTQSGRKYQTKPVVAHSYFEAKKGYELEHPTHSVLRSFILLKQNV